jgi:hypothetical protein
MDKVRNLSNSDIVNFGDSYLPCMAAKAWHWPTFDTSNTFLMPLTVSLATVNFQQLSGADLVYCLRVQEQLPQHIVRNSTFLVS